MFFFFNFYLSLFSVFFLFFSFFFFFFLLSYSVYLGVSFVLEWSIFSVFGFSVDLVLVLDWVSLSFVCVVFCISFSVVWFSKYYIGTDPFLFRFT